MSNAQTRPLATPGSYDHLDTQALRVLGADQAEISLIVVTGDATVLAGVRGAAPGIAKVSHVPGINDLATVLSELNPGVLVLDIASLGDVTEQVSQLTHARPDLVIVVAGLREQSSALMQLTAAGRIFRFLLLPLSHGQTRLALGAALAHHLELRKRPATGAVAIDHGNAGARKPMLIAAAAVALVVAGAAAWFVLSKQDSPATAPGTASTPSTLVTAPDAARSDLDLAKAAFAEGRYIEPRGESALDLYRSALAIDPDNAEAKAGITAIVDRVLQKAEQALVAGQLENAIRDIETARDIDASHSRLAFLDVQIQRERERLSLTQARDVSNRIAKLTAQARSEIRAGRLIEPAGRNARDTLLQARKLDPTAPEVTIGIRELSSALTDAARVAVGDGDLARAQSMVDAARGLGFAGATLASVERSLADSRRRPVTPTPAPAPEPQVADNRTAAPTAPAPSVTSAPAQPAATAPVRTRSPLEEAIARNEVLEAATLPRKKQVAAEYPVQAAMEGVEGWVDIDFIINTAGVPEDLKVRDSMPRRVFDRAALTSVRQWRFEPLMLDGVAVSRPATLRVRFQLR